MIRFLHILQHNAEWMCAIAIAFFAGMQCYLTHKQNMQNVRMKRLELANELDAVCGVFTGNREHAKRIQEWLVSHMSNFTFLLNEKDLGAFKQLLFFFYRLPSIALETDKDYEELIKIFTNLHSNLNLVLGKAKYDLVENTRELKPLSKDDKVKL